MPYYLLRGNSAVTDRDITDTMTLHILHHNCNTDPH